MDRPERNQRLRVAVNNILDKWEKFGINRAGILSSLRYSKDDIAAGVGTYISAPGSRKRFEEVLEKLGVDWTLESLAVSDDFGGMFVASAKDEAQRRIDSTAE